MNVEASFSTAELPAETWLQILRCLLLKRPEQRDGDTTVVIAPLSDWTGRDSSDNRLSSQVLRTSRAIYTAGIEILYCENSFELNGDDVWVFPNFLSNIGRANVSRLRHLRLDHRNSGHVDCRGSPHRHDQGVVYVNGWFRDLWIDRLFESFPALSRLQTLSIAVDLPSKKMHDAIAEMEISMYADESGLGDRLRAAKRWGDTEQRRELYDQLLLYINKLGISRAATSLDQGCPGLKANIYYGFCAHGVYGIFSRKEMEMVSSPQEQKMAAQLRAVGVFRSRRMPLVVDVLQVRRLQVDTEKGEVVEAPLYTPQLRS